MRLILTFLLLSFACSSAAQVYDRMELYEDTYDRDFIKKHKIESMRFYQPFSIYKSPATTYYFDRAGYITHVVTVNTDSIVSKETYIRNKYRDLFIRKEESIVFLRSDTLHKVYEGDRLIREESVAHTTLTEHTYNSKGLRLSTTLTALQPHLFGSIKKLIEFSYDEKDRLAEKKHTFFTSITDSIGVVVSHKILIYDGEKLVQEKELSTYRNEYMHHAEGNVNYNYNNKGQLISIKRSESSSDYLTYNGDGLVSKVRTVFPAVLDFTETIDEIRYSYYK